MNDFVIPSKNPQTAEQQRGRHFQIRFDPEALKYFIKDLGIGHGVFAKLDKPTVSSVLYLQRYSCCETI